MIAQLHAEQKLLGAVIARGQALEEVGHFLTPRHFADPVHAEIFEVASRLIEAGGTASVGAVAAAMNAEALAEVGGSRYLAQLSLVAPDGEAARCGRLIVDAWRRRQLLAGGGA